MPGFKANPLDSVLDNLVQAMVQVDSHLTEMSRDVRPFDSKELSPQEDELLFHNPSLRYIGQPDPTTGMPLTNQQASVRLLNEIGPVEFVNYVEDVVHRMDRRAQGVSEPSETPSESAPGGAAPKQTVPPGPILGDPTITSSEGSLTGGGQRMTVGGTPGTYGGGTYGGGAYGDSLAP